MNKRSFYKNRKNKILIKLIFIAFQAKLDSGFYIQIIEKKVLKIIVIKAFFWEFSKMLERALLIICLNYYDQLIVVKACLILISLIIMGVIQEMVTPYTVKEDFFNFKESRFAACGV